MPIWPLLHSTTSREYRAEVAELIKESTSRAQERMRKKLNMLDDEIDPMVDDEDADMLNMTHEEFEKRSAANQNRVLYGHILDDELWGMKLQFDARQLHDRFLQGHRIR